jgi:hypothetical protein
MPSSALPKLISARNKPACGFPLFSQRLTRGSSRTQRNIIFLCQHFGTGVLMATAFVHLLPTAFTSLTDPCLPHAFSKGYRPLAGLIAMVSALVVVALESYLTTRGASHSHSHHVWEEGDEDDDSAGGSDGDSISRGRAARRGERPATVALNDLEATQRLVSNASPLPASTPTFPPAEESFLKNHQQGEERGGEEGKESLDLELSFEELRPAAATADGGCCAQTHRKREPGQGELPHAPPSAEEQKRLLLQCVLLEAGILFHSVFIGMALSVATGPTFAVFLIAISFHRKHYLRTASTYTKYLGS